MHARHILIASGGQSDNPMAPPRSGRDQARAEVEKEKQKKVLEEIVKRSHVTVAENFQVKMPETPARRPCRQDLPLKKRQRQNRQHQRNRNRAQRAARPVRVRRSVSNNRVALK